MAGTIINLNNLTPAAPAGNTNVQWQADTNNPRNVSAYIATPAVANLSDVTLTSPTAGQLLTYSGTKWVNGSGVLTTAGDLLYENATPAMARLPIGTTGQVLTVVSGLPAWVTASSGGSVPSPSGGQWYAAAVHSNTFSSNNASGNYGVALSFVSGPVGRVAATATQTAGTSDTSSGSAGSSAGYSESEQNVCLGTFNKFQFKASFSRTTNIRWWVGMEDQGSSPQAVFRSDNPVANFFGFRFSTHAGDTHIQAYSSTDGTHFTAVDTGIAADTAVHLFEVSNAASVLTFKIDGVVVATISTNVPTTSTLLGGALLADNVTTASAVTTNVFAFFYQAA